MQIIEIWQKQKEALNSVLLKSNAPSESINHIRHAVLQTEQIALAECKNDILRQQTGILFSVIKNSIPLVAVTEVGKVWKSVQTEKNKKNHLQKGFTIAGFSLLGLLLLLSVFHKAYFSAGLCFLSIAAFLGVCIQQRRTTLSESNEYKVSLQLNQQQLFSNLDMQFRAADRYMNDFEYLNESLSLSDDRLPDAIAVQRSASLLTALCGLDEEVEDWDALYSAAQATLRCFGIKCMAYTAENSRYFSVLPSKSSTKMLCPALFSLKSDELLMQGKMVLANQTANR